MSILFTLTEAEQRTLGDLARLSIMAGFAGRDMAEELPSAPEGVLCQTLGSFVTLTRGGRLRGCMGSVVGQEPLYRNVARMARAAAFEDPRFPPLAPPEWAEICMEISVLGPLALCTDPDSVEVGRHGLLLTCDRRSGVFLPKVPVEQGWDRAAYLENLCRKAGLPAGTWRRPGAQLYAYEAMVFAVTTSPEA